MAAGSGGHGTPVTIGAQGRLRVPEYIRCGQTRMGFVSNFEANDGRRGERGCSAAA